MLFHCALALVGLIPLQESLQAFNRDPLDWWTASWGCFHFYCSFQACGSWGEQSGSGWLGYNGQISCDMCFFQALAIFSVFCILCEFICFLPMPPKCVLVSANYHPANNLHGIQYWCVFDRLRNTNKIGHIANCSSLYLTAQVPPTFHTVWNIIKILSIWLWPQFATFFVKFAAISCYLLLTVKFPDFPGFPRLTKAIDGHIRGVRFCWCWSLRCNLGI